MSKMIGILGIVVGIGFGIVARDNFIFSMG